MQKLITVGIMLSVVAVGVVSALDHRFGWSTVPTAVVVVGNVLVLVGLGLAELVVIQNNYAAATITVEEDQPVVSTGPVRPGAPPDVRRRADHDGRHAACPGVVLGLADASFPACWSSPPVSPTRRRRCARNSTATTSTPTKCTTGWSRECGDR